MQKSRIALSIKEAAATSGVGRTLICEEIREGRLIARKVKRRTVILLVDLEQWLETRPLAKPCGGSIDG
jgi:hypothetical protein